MTEHRRRAALTRIQANIETFGYHVYVVTGGPSPRWQYTIGLAPRHGAELLLAGATSYSGDVAFRVLQDLVRRVSEVGTNGTELPIEGLGIFTLRPVHRSWTDRLALGAQDFYQDENVPVWQIVPDEQFVRSQHSYVRRALNHAKRRVDLVRDRRDEAAQ